MKSIILFAMLVLVGNIRAAGDTVADAYGKITEGLIGIRKEFPVTQPKVYALLDQVEKLYKVAKSLSQECAELRKKLSDGLLATKSQLVSAKKTFEDEKGELLKRFEDQQQRLLALEKQRDQLMAKASIKSDVQVESEVKKA